jgi:hypothetical protein
VTVLRLLRYEVRFDAQKFCAFCGIVLVLVLLEKVDVGAVLIQG